MGCGSSAPASEPLGGLSKDGKTVGKSVSSGAVKQKVRDKYKIGKSIGTGGFATVHTATRKEDGLHVAMKVMDLPKGNSLEDQDTRKDIYSEIELLSSLKSDHVIRLFEFFVETPKVYLSTELLAGGDLLDAVLSSGKYTEEMARKVFQRLLLGIQDLHQVGIAHRDLKLENLLLANKSDLTTVKICDLGLAKRSTESQLKTVCGTPQYVAPEVITGKPTQKYGPEVDMWSAGVILFMLVSGTPPFSDKNEQSLFRKIRKAKVEFKSPVFHKLTDDVKDLIKKLLVKKPSERLSAAEALKHPWVALEKSNSVLLNETTDELKNTFQGKFKKAAHVVLSVNKMNKLKLLLTAAAAENAEAGLGVDMTPEDSKKAKEEREEAQGTYAVFPVPKEMDVDGDVEG